MEVILTIEELRKLLGTQEYKSNIPLPYPNQVGNYDPCFGCPNNKEGRVCSCTLGDAKITC